jgi:tetratricopeptide (TPR) repeat protein
LANRVTTFALRLLRLALIVGLAVVVTQAGQRFWAGRAGGLLALGVYLLVLLWAFVLLPRSAHAAFEGGDFTRARRRYRWLRPLVVDPAVRAAIDVSLAGCRLADADWDGALAALAEIPAERLGTSARAAWLNNRAYAHARAPRDPRQALRDIDEAMELRPDVAGFRHTRGLALFALGRTDDAIAELDGVWRRMSADEIAPELEAERCFDLAAAWRDKGELDYARDYWERAHRVAPGSPWADAARRALAAHPDAGRGGATLAAELEH